MKIDFLEEEQNVSHVDLAIYVPKGGGTVMHRNRASYGVALNVDGEKEYRFSSGESLVVKENDIIMLPKFSDYNVMTIRTGGTFCINFQCENDRAYEPFVFHLNNSEEIIKAYKKAEKVWRKEKPLLQYKCKEMLYSILYELGKEYRLPYVQRSKEILLQPAIEYIHEHYTDGLINILHLSNRCGISYEYFRKLFNKYYRCSPIQYINNLKLKRAKELLSSGLYSVAEAGFNSGFSDLSHFSRFFKANEGVSPSDYCEHKNTV